MICVDILCYFLPSYSNIHQSVICTKPLNKGCFYRQWQHIEIVVHTHCQLKNEKYSLIAWLLKH